MAAQQLRHYPLILIAIEILSAYGLKSYYYNGVRQIVVSRADLVDGLLRQYAQDASTDYATEVRGLIENFEDKDKMEIMALDMDGNVLLSSSGFEANQKAVYAGFSRSPETETGEGYFQGTLYGENILALTRISQVSDEEILPFAMLPRWCGLTGRSSLWWRLLPFLEWQSSFCGVFQYVFYEFHCCSAGKGGADCPENCPGRFQYPAEKENDDEIGELCDVINYMAGELSKAEQLKNDFISSVSHELRTPLTAIKGWAETLANEERPDPQTLHKGMEVIGKEAERLSGMVEELLDFSRMQSGRMSMVMDRMDLVAELDDAVLMFDQRAARENIEIRYEEPEDFIIVMGDHNRLKQVFVNILDNALKHTPGGGVVTVSVQRTAEEVTVTIADTGEGIKPEDLPQVKTKFYKGIRPSGVPVSVLRWRMKLLPGMAGGWKLGVSIKGVRPLR